MRATPSRHVDQKEQREVRQSLRFLCHFLEKELGDSPCRLGCTVLGAPLFATAVAAELRKRGAVSHMFVPYHAELSIAFFLFCSAASEKEAPTHFVTQSRCGMYVRQICWTESSSSIMLWPDLCN